MWHEIGTFAVAIGIMLAPTLLVVAAGCLLLGRPRPLVPPQRERAVTFGGVEVFVLFIAVLLFWPLAFNQVLDGLGLFDSYYGLCGGDTAKLAQATPEERFGHMVLLESLISLPLKLFTIWLVLSFPGGFQPYQFGLVRVRLWPMLLLGWLTWLFVGLPVDFFNMMLNHAYAFWFKQPPDAHSLAKLAEGHLLPIEWACLVLTAAIVAPILEEILFRGLLLRWLKCRPSQVFVIFGLAFLLALLSRSAQASKAYDEGKWDALLHQLAPAAFVLLVAPVAVLLPFTKLNRLVAIRWQAILASAMLFGIAHASVWPSPVPLFLLALGLGWLAERTQSIVPCIVAHGLFNATACVDLILATHVWKLPG